MDIDERRGQIDEINMELKELLLRRLALARQIGREKAIMGSPVADPRREERILAAVTADCGGDSTYVERIFREIFAVSRECQQSGGAEK